MVAGLLLIALSNPTYSGELICKVDGWRAVASCTVLSNRELVAGYTCEIVGNH